jgi:RNA polymerase sigma-70 factor (ECF subfamily)
VTDFRRRNQISNADLTLLDRAKNGDDGAFVDLVTPCKDRLYMRALSCSRDGDDADDLVQEVIIKGYRFLGQFRGESGFCAWLFSILTNTIRSFFRRKKPGRWSFSAEESVQDTSISVPEKVELTDRQEHLLNAVNNLQSKYRELLMLFYYDELSYEEISQQTGLKTGTIKSRMNRARELLQRSLSKSGFEGDDYD